uniref:Amidase n=1 Tax=Caldilinea aerophila TaxID=133453 RepID=A0A7C1JQN2_9CHLR
MDKLTSRTVSELARRIRMREVSAEAVVEAFLERIAEVNPAVNAVVQLAPDALDRARQADRDLAQGLLHGPLHGVPFTVKDVFDVAELPTAVGLEARRWERAREDAVAVLRWRQAGAILLGKTNCPPGGSGSDTENLLYGRTLNPHDLTRTPGGSSGGEAAIIAAQGSPLGLGSDSSGGLRVPAHFCGVATLKPTVGRVPNTGAYNHRGGLTDVRTQIGPLARSVMDLALTWPLLCGPDFIDAGVVPMPIGEPASVSLSDLHVAYFTSDPASPASAETVDAVGAAAQALARAGVHLEPARPQDFVRNGRGISDAYAEIASLRGQDVVELYDAWDSYRSFCLQFLRAYDAILCPVSPQPAPPFRAMDRRRFDYTLPFSLLGWPVVVVPAGRSKEGLPIGVQIAARPWREEVALALGSAVERELGKF